MKILLDENLSPRLVRRLENVLPLVSTEDLGLRQSDDDEIWVYARENRFDAIITADRDFVDLVTQHGPPPKVVRIENCNFPLAVVDELLRREALRIVDFICSRHSVLRLNLHPRRR